MENDSPDLWLKFVFTKEQSSEPTKVEESNKAMRQLLTFIHLNCTISAPPHDSKYYVVHRDCTSTA